MSRYEARIKELEAALSVEMSKIKQQIIDLVQGKQTPEAVLEEVGKQQALIDAAQDEEMLKIKSELTERIDTLQKDIKRVKMA